MSQFVEINENDRKSLECPICKNLVQVPKVVRCSHVFCESCLTDYLERSDCNCPPCPICRQRIVLPQEDLKKRSAFCREELKTMQGEIAKLTGEAISASRNVTTIYGEFLGDLQEITNDVNNTVDSFIAEMNEKREQFLKNIEGKRKEIKSRLQRQKDKVEKVKTDGQALIEMTRKASSYGNDADVVSIHNDLQQQVTALKYELNSSLHKDFRMEISFWKDDRGVNDLQQSISEYEIGKIYYFQQVAIKNWKDTGFQPNDRPVLNAAMASTDSLSLVYQRKGYLNTDYIKIHYKDKYDQRDTSITFSKTSYNNLMGRKSTTLDINEDENTKVRFYNPFSLKIGQELVYTCDNSNETATLKNLSDVFGEIIDGDVNDQGEILLIEDLNDVRHNCTIRNRDGTKKFEKLFDLDHNRKLHQPIYGSFNKMGNLLILARFLPQKRAFFLIDTTTNKVERLIMPSFPNEQYVEPAAVYEKCDGLLYITVTDGTKILTISYLP